jgi:hypothetical protein
MISSWDDAQLLLNKWMSESALVIGTVAFTVGDPASHPLPPGLVSRLTGRVSSVQSDGTFLLSAENSDDVMLVSTSGCTFGYADDWPSPSPEILNVIPRNFDSCLWICFPNSTTLIVFALEDAKK